jgi:hypothetical protein
MAAYKVWFNRNGKPSLTTSTVYADGIAEAQQKAADILEDLQRKGIMRDYEIITVTE